MSILPLHHSRFCDLDKIQMQYVNTIAYIVQDCHHIPKGLSQILDHLYLGNWTDAQNIEKLKEVGITHICNTVDGPDGFETGKEFYGNEFEYYGFQSEDEESYPILNHFDAVYEFIEAARLNGGKCMIHCMAGINRSGCLTTAYTMVHLGIGPITAAKMVFDIRGMLLSNVGFIERLVRFAVSKQLLEVDKNLIVKRFALK